ncbi:MAG: DUF4405 domain-containing protein [Sedimentisphaerales bacterium]|nr:DUF4405 domain-containing protein [Sedimentisphaerales bacterium]
MRSQPALRFRPFVSILTGFSFAAAVITGAMLFVTPPGRVANWSNWTIWGLSKEQWSALHICFCVLFTIASVVHIVLNIRPLVNYFASRIQSARRLRYEWIGALLLCGLTGWGAIKPFAPFSSLLNLNTRVKHSWDSQPGQQPPVPHAELLTVVQLAKQAEMPVEQILENLAGAGITAGPENVFGTLAEQAGYSPEKLFMIATGQSETQRRGQRRGGGEGQGESGGGGGSGGGGFGQQTLRQLCQESNLDVDTTLERLGQAGIRASADQTIRQVADENNIRPGDLRKLLVQP